jgi:hypothetical protein
MSSVLSPLAPAFHPQAFYEPVNLAIFNDGVPSCMFQAGQETMLLHGITDDALDEAFPPDASDAAELEACEFFVSLMSNLAYLEEREEAARSEYHLGLKKRWAARRELIGRPRPPRNSVHSVSHGDHFMTDSQDLVVQDNNRHSIEHQMRARNYDATRGHNQIHNNKKMMQNYMPLKNRMPIIQPRKQS